MTDEQQSRKSARGRRAKKRDDDILEESGVLDSTTEGPTRVKARSNAAAPQDDATSETAETPKKPRRTRSSAKKTDEKTADAKNETPIEKPPKKSRKKADEKADAKESKKAEKKPSKKADKNADQKAEPKDKPSKKSPKKADKNADEHTEKEPTTKEEPQDFQVTEDDGDRSSIAQLSGSEAIHFGVKWLNELLAKMKLDLNAEGRLENGGLLFNIIGPDSDTFVGTTRKSPRALISIQTLLSEAMPRFDANDLIVDLGGFQKDRQERLEEIARKLGETSRSINKSVTVAGLNNFERKVIHQALADVDDLETESIDHGIFRKLRVYPD